MLQGSEIYLHVYTEAMLSIGCSHLRTDRSAPRHHETPLTNNFDSSTSHNLFEISLEYVVVWDDLPPLTFSHRPFP